MSGHPAIAGIRLVLGGNVFGWTADRDRSFDVLDAFHAAGGRMIDTAEAYSFWVPGHKGGESETVIGEWMELRGLRAEMRIATKTNVMGDPGGLAPAKLRSQLAGSLERLRTDYVDLYYAHRDDPETPQGDVAEAFGALIADGQVREAGASNFTADRLEGALDAAKALGVPGYGVLQNEFNLVERSQYDAGILALCRANDVVGLPYYGLAAGFLTGKYRQEADLAGTERGSSVARYFAPGQPVLAVMDDVVRQTGASHAQVALAWIIARPGIAAPIASATSVAQVQQLCAATSLCLNEEQLARLTAAGR